MKRGTLIAGIVGAWALTACALLPPSSESMSRLPVVRYGQTAPADGQFILHYPAGAPLPVETRLHGSLLEQEARGELTVRIKRDVYVYKNWASLDGKHWQASNQLIGGHFEIRVPGDKDARNPGMMRAEFNLK